MTTLDRNYPKGESAVVIQPIEDKIFIIGYKQENGMSNFKDELFRVELTDDRLACINREYDLFKRMINNRTL